MGSCRDPSTACRELRGTPVGMTVWAWRELRGTPVGMTVWACRELRGTPVGMTVWAWRELRGTPVGTTVWAWRELRGTPVGMTKSEMANPRPRHTPCLGHPALIEGHPVGALVCAKFPSRLRASGACGMTVWRLVGKGPAPEGVSYVRRDFFVGA